MIGAVGHSLPTRAATPDVSAVGAPPSSKANDSCGSNPELKYLSKSDLELVYQATGQRIDASSELVPMFAIQLANDRQYGNLPPQGPISSDYLTELISKYRDQQWMVDQATRALDWVNQRGGTSGVDLTA